MFKGAYTLSKAMNETDNDGRATLTWNTPSELWRNWAPAGFDRRHNFQLGLRLRAAVAEQTAATTASAKAILGDWQLNGVVAAFSGTPFTVTASGTSLNTPSNTQNGRPGRRLTTSWATSATPASGSTRRPSRSRPASASATPAGTSSTVRARGRRTCRCSGRSRWAASGGSKRASRANNIFNHPVFGNPNATFTSGTFGQITGINGNGSYLERQFQVGVRFTF